MRSSKSRRRRGPAAFDRDSAPPADRAAHIDHDARAHRGAIDLDSYQPFAAPAANQPVVPDPGPLTEEDLDDSEFFRRRERRHTPHHRHKHQQLAAQVAAIVGEAIAVLDDPRLSALVVVGAAPAPDAGRMVISVVDRDGGSVDDVAALLARVRGTLRAEVAAGISRRRAPELSFAVVAAVDEEAP
jgi:ribosome-binding factor A